MDTTSYKTISANKATSDKKWLLIDAEGQVLGRLANGIAKLLRGKHKTSFTPHADCGDYVIVVNAANIKLTGKKWDDKIYIRHTGYPGGQRTLTARELHEKSHIALVEKAVKGNLPKNRLGRQMFSNMHVYEGSEHQHEAQKPKEIKLSDI